MTQMLELLRKLEEIDQRWADRYDDARERGDEYGMDRIASERVGLQRAIELVKEASKA